MLDFFEKIQAVMIGHAVADALGVPVEFCSRSALDADPVTEMRGFGSHRVPKGTWSDDTSMALAALDSLSEDEVNYQGIMENFYRWYMENAYTATGTLFDIGGACAMAIGNYAANKARPAYECGRTDERSNGNGSLMRIHPFVLYACAKKLPEEEFLDLIRKGSALTHGHERSILGCLIYSFVLRELLNRPEKEAIREGLRLAKERLAASPELSHYHRLLDGDIAALPREEIKSSGYVVDTLEAAIWCVLTADDYRGAVLAAVNLGEDTDTVAAVAGGLAGALFGYEAIPEEWREALLAHETIDGICAVAAINWFRS